MWMFDPHRIHEMQPMNSAWSQGSVPVHALADLCLACTSFSGDISINDHKWWKRLFTLLIWLWLHFQISKENHIALVRQLRYYGRGERGKGYPNSLIAHTNMLPLHHSWRSQAQFAKRYLRLYIFFHPCQIPVYLIYRHCNSFSFLEVIDSFCLWRLEQFTRIVNHEYCSDKSMYRPTWYTFYSFLV